MEKSNKGKTIGALLLGTAFGAMLGILFAPDKGKETRKKLSTKGGNLTDAMKEKITEFLKNIKGRSDIDKFNSN